MQFWALIGTSVLYRGTHYQVQELPSIETGSTPANERNDSYENIDILEDVRKQFNPPQGEYELTQCAAYGPLSDISAQ